MGKSQLTGEGVGLEWLEWLIRCCSHGLLAFDHKSRYLVWNPAMERISGMTGGQCLGRVAGELFPFMVETGLDQFHKQTLDGESCIIEDHPYKIPQSGKQGAMEVHYRPIRSAKGQVVGGVGVIQDVTERKARHDEAERSRRELRYLTTRLREMLDEERETAARHLRDDLGKTLEGLADDLTALGQEVDGEQADRVQAMGEKLDAALATVRRLAAARGRGR